MCVLEYYLHGMKYKYYKHKYDKWNNFSSTLQISQPEELYNG
jgi:hypothetical protein